jgi:hypothetical protein
VHADKLARHYTYRLCSDELKWTLSTSFRYTTASRGINGTRFNPAGVICEIVNDDGAMARGPDLVRFCEKHLLLPRA